MNISGILVIVSPQRVESMVDHLNGLDGIDVHHIEAATGRIVITQEAETINDEVDGLKRIRALPGSVDGNYDYSHSPAHTGGRMFDLDQFTTNAYLI